ncbi:hypothetical protein BH09PAT1_BH09PAT1_1740 [soil metagenome]
MGEFISKVKSAFERTPRPHRVEVTSVSEALRSHRNGTPEVVFNYVPEPAITLPEPAPSSGNDGEGNIEITDSEKPTTEFMADNIVQTIPYPTHPIADRIVSWGINGGSAPLDETQFSNSAKEPSFNDDGIVVFEGVISEIEQINPYRD